MNKQVIIIGASGHGKVILDIVQACGDQVLGFLDDFSKAEWCCGAPILGKTADVVRYPDAWFVIGIGANPVRRRLGEELELNWYTAIHPTAVISPTARIGEGSVVMPRAVVQAEAVVGRHCIVNTAAVVEHENHIADYVHISPGAALGGNVRVGVECHIGIGACVRNNVSICGGCTVGAGAAVVCDLNEPGVYAGVPARRLK